MEKKKFNMSKDGLKAFFNKYSVIELEEIKNMIMDISDYDCSEVVSVLNEVLIKKYKKCRKNFKVPVMPIAFKASYIADRDRELSRKELNFLSDIVVNCFDGKLNNGNNDDLDDISLLIGIIDDDINKRIIATNQKVFSKKRKKLNY